MQWWAAALALLLAAAAPVASAPNDAQDAFTADLAARFRAFYPDLAVEVAEPLTLALGDKDQSLTANLDRIYKVCQTNDAPICETGKTDFVTGIAQEIAALKNPEVATPSSEALRLLIREAGYCAEIAGIIHANAKPSQLVFAPFTTDTCVMLMFDFPTSRRTATLEDIKKLGLNRDEAWQRARLQVLAPLPKIATLDLKENSLSVFADMPDSTSLVLDTAGWSALAARHPGKQIIVTIPDDSFLTVLISAPDVDLDGLRKATQETYDSAQRGISPALLRWNESGWQIIQ